VAKQNSYLQIGTEIGCASTGIFDVIKSSVAVT
jgi:hypothetical protein